MPANKFKQFLSIFQKQNPVQKELAQEQSRIKKEIDFIIDQENKSQLKILAENDVVLSFKQLVTIIVDKNKLLHSVDWKKHASIYQDELKEFFINEFKVMAGTTLGRNNFTIEDKNVPATIRFSKTMEFFQYFNHCINFTEKEAEILYKEIGQIQKKPTKKIIIPTPMRIFHMR